MEDSSAEWEKLIEEECERKFGIISNELMEGSKRNQRRAKRLHNYILQLFASNYISDKDYKKRIVDSVMEDASTTLKVHKEELIEGCNLIPRKTHHLRFPKMLEERKRDTLPKKIIWVSDLTTYFNGVSGEDWFSYDVLTGKKLSTICEELMPHFFNAASYLFTGKELKREKEIGRYWPKIVYLLIDSQNHPDSVITNTLFIESKSKNVDVAKYLLQQTPTTGYAYTAIYEPSEDLLSHIRERADKFKEKCELPTLSKKLDLTKFKEYSTSLIFFILSHKLKGEKVENYIENLRKMAKINPDFLPTLYNIEERVKTAISMSY